MKRPDECSNIQDIRDEIDQIDHQTVIALGRRYGYVKAASKFKTSETSVRAPERVVSMLQQRRVWAEEEGLSPEIIEKLFRDLVTYFSDEELKQWHDEH